MQFNHAAAEKHHSVYLSDERLPERNSFRQRRRLRSACAESLCSFVRFAAAEQQKITVNSPAGDGTERPSGQHDIQTASPHTPLHKDAQTVCP